MQGTRLVRGTSSSTTAAAALLIAGTVFAGCLTLAGCGAPPQPDDPPVAAVPTRQSASTTAVTPAGSSSGTQSPTPSPTASRFSELVAVDCHGNPNAAEVITLLRNSSGLLPPTAPVTVLRGPFCAGDWQYTTIRMAGRDPLDVVSYGPASAMTLVTAGTDVCNVPVRTAAPPGIRTVACAGGSVPTPGA
jgi:hypothetical protein